LFNNYQGSVYAAGGLLPRCVVLGCAYNSLPLKKIIHDQRGHISSEVTESGCC